MILLTGATGYAGSYLLYELVGKGEKVRAVKRPESSLEQVKFAFRVMNKDQNFTLQDYLEQIEWVDADLTDFNAYPSLLDDIHEIYHAAALVSFHNKDKKKIEELNVGATANLVNSALQNHIKKFNFISSVASLDRNDDGICDEQNLATAKIFRSAYSKSKYMAEIEVWRGFHEGLQGVIVNPGVILGPATGKTDVLRIFNMIRKGFRYYTSGQNGYVDVRDIARFTLMLAGKESACCQRFLLVSENVRYKDMFDLIAREFGVLPPRKEAGKTIQKMVYFADRIRSTLSGKAPVITRELIDLINSNYEYKNTKVLHESGLEFIPVATSIADTCRYMKENPVN